MLHILALQSSLESDDQDLLRYLLSKDSLQRINLGQLDFEFKSPLVVAIESSNMDFIKICLESEASLEV